MVLKAWRATLPLARNTCISTDCHCEQDWHRRKIQKLLAMEECMELVENPNRENIKLHVSNVPSSEPLSTTFDWLLRLVRTEALCLRLLVFCKTIGDCAKIYEMCKSHLNEKQMKLVEMYHSHTPENIKAKIREDMAVPEGCIRALVCTTAASMGINYAGVDNVVNFGPPQELNTLLQQQGWAGREGGQAHHLLIFNNRQLRNLDTEMLIYVRNEDSVCRRHLLLSHYDACCDEERSLHACCDICTASCTCGTPGCKQFNHIAHSEDDDNSSTSSDSDEESETYHVTDQQQQAVKLSLEQYRAVLNEQFKSGSVTTVPEVTHGFTQTVIDNVVSQCTSFKSPDDVLARGGVWSYEQATAVYEIVRSIFDFDLEETVSDTEYIEVDD
ncbi:hypothetical protein Bbelb_394050 [Branchiostoma belcheri]|nr:hypothetical protein Bbelb_394050 [Branchiostoma belcheri]